MFKWVRKLWPGKSKSSGTIRGNIATEVEDWQVMQAKRKITDRVAHAEAVKRVQLNSGKSSESVLLEQISNATKQTDLAWEKQEKLIRATTKAFSEARRAQLKKEIAVSRQLAKTDKNAKPMDKKAITLAEQRIENEFKRLTRNAIDIAAKNRLNGRK